jgi:capsular polysaccharide biosynthesis protein
MGPVFHSFSLDVVKRIKNNISSFSVNISFNRRIFITRSSSYRDIKNKIQVEEYFKKLDFYFVNPEDFSYEDLVLTIGQADIVIMFCYDKYDIFKRGCRSFCS